MHLSTLFYLTLDSAIILGPALVIAGHAKNQTIWLHTPSIRIRLPGHTALIARDHKTVIDKPLTILAVVISAILVVVVLTHDVSPQGMYPG